MNTDLNNLDDLLPLELASAYFGLDELPAQQLRYKNDTGKSRECHAFETMVRLTSKQFSGSLCLLYQCSFLRQISDIQRLDIFKELANNGQADAAKWLDANYNEHLEKQLSTIHELDEASRRELTTFVETRDRVISVARALRMAMEIMQFHSDDYGQAGVCLKEDLLQKITLDPGLRNVVFGLKQATWLDGALWKDDDLVLIEGILWVMAQIEGLIIQIMRCPDGRLVIYNEYALKSIALGLNSSIAYTREGLEHLIKIAVAKESGELYEQIETPLKANEQIENIIASVLLTTPQKRFLKWDDNAQIWLPAGLGKQVWTLSKYPLDAKALNVKDRPASLKKQLSSELANQIIFNQPIPLIVVDDESTEQNLKAYLPKIDELRKEFQEPLSFVTGPEKIRHIGNCSRYIAANFQKILDNGSDNILAEMLNETQTDKSTKETYQIVNDGVVDPKNVERFVRDSPLYHISGIRNYTFLLFLSKGIKTMMNFDDDAPPETYCVLPKDRRTVASKRKIERDRVFSELIKEASTVFGPSLLITDEQGLYQAFVANRDKLAAVEQKYFGYCGEGINGLLPKASEEIVPLSGSRPCRFTEDGLEVSDGQSSFFDDKIKLTHQRYESIQLPLPDFNIAVTDFVYPEPRKEKRHKAFMTIPVNTMTGAQLVGKKVKDTDFMCMDGDLRGTMGVPASKSKVDALQEKTITYVPFPFILDQDTSGLAQFVRYLQIDNKHCTNLQHTNRSALVAGHVHAFVADTYVIFNRSVYDITFSTPSIGQTLRFEEPPLVKWVRGPLSNNDLTVCFSPVGGGQERVISDRFYMIPFQDYNEIVGGISRFFYEKAVEQFNLLQASDMTLQQADLEEKHHRLGRCFMNVASASRLSEEDKNDLLGQREYRASLLSRLALQRAQKESLWMTCEDSELKRTLKRELNDMDLILIRYADQFFLYHASEIPNRERTNAEDDLAPINKTKDYFYQITVENNQLRWSKAVPNFKLGQREDVTNPVIVEGGWTISDESRACVITDVQRDSAVESMKIEIEPGRIIILETLPDAHPIIVPAIIVENEQQYLQQVEKQLFTQIKQDGESIYIWPDLVEAAQSGKCFKK